MGRYRKKDDDSAKVDPILWAGPETVDALLWKGPENSEEVFDFLGLAHPDEEWTSFHAVNCQTYRGMVAFAMGEWIVKDGQGDPRPVKQDVFAATYEKVSG